MEFDQIIDRSQYPSVKWNKASWQQHFGSDDLLPFWVADMEFEGPPVVVNTLVNRAEHGVFGYEYKSESYYDVLVGWYRERHQWVIEPSYLEPSPSVLNIIAILINQHSAPGEGIIVQPPVFFEFRMVIRSNCRRMVKNPLNLVNGRYEIDYDNLEEKASDPRNKMMIICNPHNPVGHVWTRQELMRVSEICTRYNVVVISDEIHGDIVYVPYRYTPYISISKEAAENSVACLAAGKTFNIAGMVDALAVIPETDRRAHFQDFTHRYQINKTNVFASAAVEAAYSQGGPWLDQLLNYLRGNIRFMQSYLNENLPQVSLVDPEGTYLAWLNFQGLGLDVKELQQFLAQKARIGVSPGYWFGREGAGFARMNFACPQRILEEALIRLTRAVNELL